MTYTNDTAWIASYLASSPDFPKAGVIFHWYGALLKDPEAFHRLIESFAKRYEQQKIEAIVGIEARGFIFAATLAYRLKIPLILARKPGKLPGRLLIAEYETEYGMDKLAIEADALKKGQRILVMDDLIATGGTSLAACHIADKAGAKVIEIACVLELARLEARKKLPYPVFSLLSV